MEAMDPVIYTVTLTHWACGDVGVLVEGVGHSDSDRASVAWALTSAAAQVARGQAILTRGEGSLLC